MFTWKKKAPKVTEEEKVEETQEENKEEVTPEPEQNGDEAQEVEGEEVEEKSAENEKDSLNALCSPCRFCPNQPLFAGYLTAKCFFKLFERVKKRNLPLKVK